MRTRAILALATAALAAAVLAAGPALAQERTFVSPLTGAEEVPLVETDASGDATYTLGADGVEMMFRVDVAGLVDTTMAHIHLGAAGENGPPVVWLHVQETQAPELVPGETTGTLASGTFTADDLVGPLEGGTIEDLVAEMAAGNTYTNVHTEAHPAGEIRGQIVETSDAPADGTDGEAPDGTTDDGADDADDADDTTDDAEASTTIEQPTRIDTGAGGSAAGPDGRWAALVGLLGLFAVGLFAARRTVPLGR